MSIRLMILALLSGSVVGESRNAFSFLPGTWEMRKDGFSFTVRVEPILDGLGYRQTLLLDENNREVAESMYTFQVEHKSWTRTQFSRTGQMTRFESGPSGNGIALEMTQYESRAFKVPVSRLLFTRQGEDSFTMDWQNRRDESSGWQPRPTPFTYRRVSRPQPPAFPGRIAFISNRSGNWEVYTMSPEGGDTVNITQHDGGDHLPRWIAGGSRLAFLSQRDAEKGGWMRWEVDRDGTDLRRVPLPQGLGTLDAGMFPEVHPTGSYLVYSAERNGESQLYVSRFDGGGERALAHAPGADYRPKWSPDGQRVLFVSERDGNPELYVTLEDGSEIRRLTRNPGNDRYAQWSPDGEFIVFASDRDTGKSLDLYVMNRNGGDLRRLTNNVEEDGEPSWSPDGDRIVFRSNASGNAEICVVTLADGEIRNITKHPKYDGEPVWSPLRR